MDFKEVQKKVLNTATEYSKKYGIKIDREFASLKLYEEVGEFSQALLIHDKKSRPEKHVSKEESKKHLAEELADIVGIVMLNANLLDIDLEKAILDKWSSEEGN